MLDRIGIRLPIIQAPMAGVSTPAMAAAVSEAGGLGSIGIGATDADGGRGMIEALRAQTARPFNVNVFVHATPRADPARAQAWLEALAPAFAEFGAAPPAALRCIYPSFNDAPELLAMLLETRPPVVSFHFGLPGAPVVRPVPAPASGVVAAIDTRAVGEAVVHLGGGRLKGGDPVDPRVGFSALAAPGDAVGADAPLAMVHAADQAGADRAIAALQAACRLGDAPVSTPLVQERVA